MKFLFLLNKCWIIRLVDWGLNITAIDVVEGLIIALKVIILYRDHIVIMKVLVTQWIWHIEILFHILHLIWFSSILVGGITLIVLMVQFIAWWLIKVNLMYVLNWILFLTCTNVWVITWFRPISQRRRSRYLLLLSPALMIEVHVFVYLNLYSK